MEKDNIYATVVTLIAIICAIGWSSAATSASNSYSEQIDELQTQISSREDGLNSYKYALEEANNAIDEANQCMENIISDAEFDNTYLGLLDAINNNICTVSNVSDPIY